MSGSGVPGYAEAYRQSVEDPETFWRAAAKDVHWIDTPAGIVDRQDAAQSRWFPDGTLNTCFNALDRHVALGRAEQVALIYDSPVTGFKRQYSYADLTERTAKFAGVLRALGVVKGDRVLLYLPMIAETVIAMLACARLGAVHCVASGELAPSELAFRIDDAQPKVVVSVSRGIDPTPMSGYKPTLDQALTLSAHKPERCVMVQRPQSDAPLGESELDYTSLMRSSAIQPTECVEVAATDPLYVLHTSSANGKLQRTVRDNGGHAVALRWSMTHIYDIGPGEVLFTAADIGSAVGHSYLVYAPLLTGATTVLYARKPLGTPDAGAYWRVAAEYGVKTLITTPAAIRELEGADPDGAIRSRYDLSCLRTVFLTDERLDPGRRDWEAVELDAAAHNHRRVDLSARIRGGGGRAWNSSAWWPQ
ncbi:MAG: propionyl-CoA synthetase [Pseudonocardiales bacterium]|nr:propionyl-CoA synthetase [Pseudonocardiales bacterium]